ncbi:hypothetical protein SAMN04488514_10225 [Kriegella aquimaris]|uniref:Uncharacterized protein n=1 Tax=Kriegella aquimaris TaxID=192904 RepID=A0A1G9LF31_9FLAO|nr:hypothetical protein SAMN04488514_10225 [Kriegella aquimaris]
MAINENGNNWTHNQVVPGSSPGGTTTTKTGLPRNRELFFFRAGTTFGQVQFFPILFISTVSW